VIPKAHVQEWSLTAPWVGREQVEQDLLLTRTLVEIYQHPLLKESLACRGGTALNKVHLRQYVRYSEDIDFAQVRAEPIGPVVEALRGVMQPVLGRAQWKQSEGRVTLVHKVTATEPSGQALRVKLEINSREHFIVLGPHEESLSLQSSWFSGSAQVLTYDIHELLGTKLRALFQRKKGRDLFDLWYVAQHQAIDGAKVVECFQRYMRHAGLSVSRAEYEQNLANNRSE
jgi:predicted nucleotidyltransferase component of viral defense system